MEINELRYVAADGQTKATATLYVANASTLFEASFLKRTFRAEFYDWKNQQLYAQWYLAALIRKETRFYGCQLVIKAIDEKQQEIVEKAVKAKADEIAKFSGDDKMPFDEFEWSKVIAILNAYAYRKGKELRISQDDITIVREAAADAGCKFQFLAEHIQRKIARVIAPTGYGAGAVAQDKKWAWKTYMPFIQETE